MAKFVDINGNQVIDLTPDYNRPLALVDITVLNKLTELLPKADFGQIRHSFREQIMTNTNLEQLVQTCEDFVSFHRSVNLIREVLQGELSGGQQEVREPDENNHLYD
jgi:hypothetical protein